MPDTHKVAFHHHIIEHNKKGTRLASGTAQLTYFIFEGVLVGTFGAEMVHLSAWSGGGAGSTKNGADETANNPYMYALKESAAKGKGHVHGGPIPPGLYQIHAPSLDKKLGLCARLHPESKVPNDRGGFAIHGTGPHGSDGCIVLTKHDLVSLMEKLRRSHGGKLIVLQSMFGSFA